MKQEQTERIEKYLNGNFSEAEKADFEKEVLLDKSLAEELELQQAVMGGIERVALKNEMKTVFRTQQRRMRNLKWGVMAGTFALLCFTTLLFVVLNKRAGSSEGKVSKTRAKAHVFTPGNAMADIPKTESVADTPHFVATRLYESKAVRQSSATNSTDNALANSSFTLPPDFLPKKLLFVINPQRDTVLKINAKGTLLRIKAHSFKNKEGKTVSAPVSISWREYTNAAEMAFSKIPMTYKEKGEEYNFNSAGMFEIKGEAKGEPVDMMPGKTMTIDYALTKQIPDIDFYKLDERKGEWEKKQNISSGLSSYTTGFGADVFIFGQQALEFVKVEEGYAYETPFSELPKNKKDSVDFEKIYGKDWSRLIKGIKLKDTLVPLYEKVGDLETREQRKKLVILKGGQRTTKFVKELNMRDNGFHQIVNNAFYSAKKDKMVLTMEDSVKIIQNAQRQYFGLIENSSLQYYDGLLTGKDYRYNTKELFVDSFIYGKNKRYLVGTKKIPIDTEYSLLKEKEIASQQTYSKIITGLSVVGFGVYNCDQVNRIKNPITVKPSLLNERGEQITDIFAVSLIDMEYNAAFGFGTGSFVCNAAGTNNLLVFTQKNQLFAYSSSDFKSSNITSSGSYTLKMKEITNEVKNTADLKKFLGLRD